MVRGCYGGSRIPEKISITEGSGKNQERKRSGCCVQYTVLVKQVTDSSGKILRHGDDCTPQEEETSEVDISCLEAGDIKSQDTLCVAYYIGPVHLTCVLFLIYCFNLPAILILVLFSYICIS